MILADYPPLTEITEDVPAVSFYCDEDGGYWVPVEEEPDHRLALLRAEATSGVHLIPEDPPRVMAPVRNCEIGHQCRDEWTCDAHPECPTTPCPSSVQTDCWAFLNVADTDEFRAGLLYAWNVR